MTVSEQLKHVERKQVASEWDGCWFCDDCYIMKHYKTKAYIIGNKKLCENCAKAALNLKSKISREIKSIK